MIAAMIRHQRRRRHLQVRGKHADRARLRKAIAKRRQVTREIVGRGRSTPGLLGRGTAR